MTVLNEGRMSRRVGILSVAFDLGGVVVDVDKSHLAALVPPGLDIDDTLARAWFGERHDRLSVGQLSGDDYLDGAAAILGITTAAARAAWQRVVRWSPGGLALFTEVTSLVPTRVWSNTDPVHWQVLGPAIEAAIEAARPGHTVDVAASFVVGAMKPEARYFARALDGADPATVLFIDDLEANVGAARAAGVDAVLVRGVDDARRVLRARGVPLRQ